MLGLLLSHSLAGAAKTLKSRAGNVAGATANGSAASLLGRRCPMVIACGPEPRPVQREQTSALLRKMDRTESTEGIENKNNSLQKLESSNVNPRSMMTPTWLLDMGKDLEAEAFKFQQALDKECPSLWMQWQEYCGHTRQYVATLRQHLTTCSAFGEQMQEVQQDQLLDRMEYNKAPRPVTPGAEQPEARGPEDGGQNADPEKYLSINMGQGQGRIIPSPSLMPFFYRLNGQHPLRSI